MKDLSSKRVAIVATDGFEQSELVEPKKALEAAGATTEVISLKAGRIRGWASKDWGDEVAVDAVIDDASADDYDALVLPGGVMNPDKLRTNDAVLAFVRAFFEQGKPVGAICHGPWTLINAGVVKGRHLTSWPSLQLDLQNAGATWTDEEVVDVLRVAARRILVEPLRDHQLGRPAVGRASIAGRDARMHEGLRGRRDRRIAETERQPQVDRPLVRVERVDREPERVHPTSPAPQASSVPCE